MTDALGDDYWSDSEIPEEMLNETYGVSADLYDAFAYKESEPSRYYKLGMGVVNIIQDVAMHD